MDKKETFGSELAKKIPVDKIYDDAFHPAISEVGRGLQGAVRIALAPISAMVWGYDKICSYLDIAIPTYFAKRKICADKIQTGDIAIAVPVIEAMRYTSEKEIIRQMFVNLLGATMNAETTDFVHPAFVEIIKQLSTDEAKLLKSLRNRMTAMIDFEIKIENYNYMGFNYCDVQDDNIEMYINNYIRLGLYEKVLVSDDPNHPEFKMLIDAIFKECADNMEEDIGIIPSVEDLKNGFNPKYYWFKLTEFGETFVNLCVDEAGEY